MISSAKEKGFRDVLADRLSIYCIQCHDREMNIGPLEDWVEDKSEFYIKYLFY